MKSFKQYAAALFLSLILCSTAFADGQMPGGGITEPPPPATEGQMPGGGRADILGDPLTEAAAAVLQFVLSIF